MPEPTDEAKALLEKDAEIARLKAELGKAEDRVTNAEKKFSEWSNEVGEIRKERELLRALLADAEKTIGDAKKAAEARGLPHEKQGAPAEKKDEEKPEDIENALTDDQRKATETAFNTLTPEEKVRYASDSVFRLAFLRRVKDSLPAIPTTPWTTKPDEGKPRPDGVDAILDRVFNKKKKSSFVPVGPRGGAVGTSINEPYEPPEDSRVH
jgi:uncharacterized protein YdcH (DUF465 family)